MQHQFRVLRQGGQKSCTNVPPVLPCLLARPVSRAGFGRPPPLALLLIFPGAASCLGGRLSGLAMTVRVWQRLRVMVGAEPP